MGEIPSVTSKNKNRITVKISNNNLNYDCLLVTHRKVISKESKCNIESEKSLLLNKDLSCGDFHQKTNCTVIFINGILAHYVIQELRISPFYRRSFINKVRNTLNNEENMVMFELVPPEKQIIDYSWNERTTNMAWERVELDHTLSWLSTLGGAFSALGDYFSNCALMAGKISFHQLQLAVRLGDPTVASRCRLYFSLSLIQRGYLRFARNIITKEYNLAKHANIVDIRLIKMCCGIWAKLKYEYAIRKKKYKI